MTVRPPDHDTELAQRKRVKPATLRIVALAIAALCLGSYFALNSLFLQTKAQETPRQAQFFATAIDDALVRLAHLPYVLAIDPLTSDALQTGQTDQLNPILATVAEKSGAEFVYVMDINGQAVASSNYASSESLVNNYYTFRPYFRDAVEGRTGRFFAVGVTTGRPGYFISEPVRDENSLIVGVVVVKIGFGDLSRALADSGELVLVTNPEGVVVASSDAGLVYGLLSPLEASERRRLEEQQQFGNETLFPLDWSSNEAGRARLNNINFLWTRTDLKGEEWTLHLLSDVSDIRRQALLYVSIGVVVIMLLTISAAFFRAAQLRKALVVSNTDRRRLVDEIEERKAAEARLAAAREQLERKNQMAALGQLSVSITHELGQPISAMRNYLAAEEIASDVLPGTLFPQLSGLVDRMQRLLDQLRLFGRNDPMQTEHFSLQAAIKAAVQLVRHTAESANITIDVTVPTAPCQIVGQSNRFEQVIVNLLRNAIDAVADIEGKTVALSLNEGAENIELSVADNGYGLGGLNMDDLREPFFSTKPSGKGMGLGLAISAQIINEMGGELRAKSNKDGGAVFSVILPKSEPVDV